MTTESDKNQSTTNPLEESLMRRTENFPVSNSAKLLQGVKPKTSAPVTGPIVSPVSKEPPQKEVAVVTPPTPTEAIIVAEVLAPDDENDVLSILPQDAIGRRTIKNIKKQVAAWTAPKTLGKHDENRFRSVAVMARFVSTIDVATKHNIGTFLFDAKSKLKHGEYQQFIEIACGLVPRTARKYIKIAQVFPDVRIVSLLGFDWCSELASLDLPPTVIERLHAVENRQQAEVIVQEWEELQTISSGWMGLLINHDPIAIFGRDFALKLAQAPYVKELRELIVEKGADKAEDLMNSYNGLLVKFGDGQAVVRAMRGAQTSDETLLKTTFRAQSLRTRLDSLSHLEGLPLDQESQTLTKQIEDQILTLQRLLEVKSVK